MTLTKRTKKSFDSNCTRMLWAILNKSWEQHSTKLYLYRHLPPISKTIKIRRTRDAGYCWRSKGEQLSDVLLWNPLHRRTGGGRPARTYIQQLCTDTGCTLEDPSNAMDERDEWRESQYDNDDISGTWRKRNKKKKISSSYLVFCRYFFWITFRLCLYIYIYIYSQCGTRRKFLWTSTL